MRPIRSTCLTPENCPGYFWPANLPPDHPLANQFLPCTCTLARQAAALQVALPAGLRAKTFERFQIEEGNRDAFELARQFAADPWQEQCWLVLVGGNGRGKTHLAAAIVNALLGRGEPAYFEGVPALLDWLRAGYDCQTDDFEHRLTRVKNAAVLVLDDLGAESDGRDGRVTWAEDKLYQIVNHRLEGQLPTVFTTNLPLEPTPRCPKAISPRIASRLQDRRIARVKAITTDDKRKAPAGGATS